MNPARLLWLCLLLLALLPGCAAPEPRFGCALAAANRREVLRARAYLHPAIPARILAVGYRGRSMGHAALVYRLDEGWFAYDDSAGTRPLALTSTTAFPDPLRAARAAFPGAPIAFAGWYGSEALTGVDQHGHSGPHRLVRRLR